MFEQVLFRQMIVLECLKKLSPVYKHFRTPLLDCWKALFDSVGVLYDPALLAEVKTYRDAMMHGEDITQMVLDRGQTSLFLHFCRSLLIQYVIFQTDPAVAFRNPETDLPFVNNHSKGSLEPEQISTTVTTTTIKIHVLRSPIHLTTANIHLNFGQGLTHRLQRITSLSPKDDNWFDFELRVQLLVDPCALPGYRIVTIKALTSTGHHRLFAATLNVT